MGQAMEKLARTSKANTTSQVLAHVERIKGSLRNINADIVSIDGVFFHPPATLMSLKAARKELDEAISLMEQARWT